MEGSERDRITVCRDSVIGVLSREREGGMDESHKLVREESIGSLSSYEALTHLTQRRHGHVDTANVKNIGHHTAAYILISL
jgi:hypothetical protein